MTATPLAQAMVICDAVWSDPTTGKNFLLGTFTSIAAASFPCTHPEMRVYVVITDCRGKTPLTLRLVYIDPEDTSHDEHVVETEMEIDSPSPLATGELVFGLENVVFAKAGEYRFQLECRGAPLIERRLVVAQQEQ